MKSTRTILDQILVDVRKELAEAQSKRPLAELRRMSADAPKVCSFRNALAAQFGLIAEIKERSPSHGPMRAENVQEAAAAYEENQVVRAISVLTNSSHFGMSIERLREVKVRGTKPVLRKDFIFDEYQVYEARAFGADAVLLMANLLEKSELEQLYKVTKELGMDVLFECHNREQIEQLPAGATIYGINSRTFEAKKNVLGVGTYGVSALLGKLGSSKDLTVDLARFDLVQYVPPNAIKVAESGISPGNAAALRDQLRYHAALVGTSLLSSKKGIAQELAEFQRELSMQ